MRHTWTALVLLLIGLAANYIWQFGPLDLETKGQVWNICGALYRLALLLLLAISYSSTSVRLVCGLLVLYDLMVAGCSMTYLYRPWPILPDQEACSSLLNIPLGLVGALLALGLLVFILRSKENDSRH